MSKPRTHTIYTIGPSTRSFAEFLGMLQSFGIKILADIRSLPGSRRFPHLDKENSKISLEETGIQYIHMADLGGKRKAKKDSKNTRWNNDSFRGYADYMDRRIQELSLKYIQKIRQAS